MGRRRLARNHSSPVAKRTGEVSRGCATEGAKEARRYAPSVMLRMTPPPLSRVRSRYPGQNPTIFLVSASTGSAIARAFFAPSASISSICAGSAR